MDASTQLLDLDSAEAIDALIAGEIDVAIFASQLDTSFLQRALGAPGLRLINVAQAEAIAKTVPGLKHLVLSRGIVSLTRDIPDSDSLQYLLLEAMREVHWAPGPFNRFGEFPAEQPNDLPLSPTHPAFTGGSTFIASINCTALWEILNANSLTAPTDPGLASIRHDSQKLNPPWGMFKVARPFEIDLRRLRPHLRMVQEDVSRMAAVN